MFTWNHVDWGENINRGVTSNGFPFYEIEIKGWNDNQHYSDLENLIAIKVIKTPLFTKVKVDYLHPDARNNFSARKLANETKKYLIHTMKSYL